MMNPGLLKEYEALLTGRYLTDLANTSAFIFSEVKNINWAGFYLLRDGKLWLGPFQGKPACTEIVLGKGVCGTAAVQRKTLLVSNVHQFPGHITCDPASNSEIVIPLVHKNELLGVLDVDSATLNRFSAVEARFLESIVSIMLNRQTSFTC